MFSGYFAHKYLENEKYRHAGGSPTHSAGQVGHSRYVPVAFYLHSKRTSIDEVSVHLWSICNKKCDKHGVGCFTVSTGKCSNLQTFEGFMDFLISCCRFIWNLMIQEQFLPFYSSKKEIPYTICSHIPLRSVVTQNSRLEMDCLCVSIARIS